MAGKDDRTRDSSGKDAAAGVLDDEPIILDEDPTVIEPNPAGIRDAERRRALEAMDTREITVAETSIIDADDVGDLGPGADNVEAASSGTDEPQAFADEPTLPPREPASGATRRKSDRTAGVIPPVAGGSGSATSTKAPRTGEPDAAKAAPARASGPPPKKPTPKKPESKSASASQTRTSPSDSARKAPAPMALDEGTGFTVLISKALIYGERKRRLGFVAGLAVLIVLLGFLYTLSTPVVARLKGWPPRLEPAATSDATVVLDVTHDGGKATTRAGDASRGAGTARKRQAGGALPEVEDPIEALDTAAPSRKLGSSVDAAAEGLRPDEDDGMTTPAEGSRGALPASAEEVRVGASVVSDARAAGAESARLEKARVTPGTAGKVVSLRGMSPGAAGPVFQANEKQFRYCYEGALERNPAAGGKLSVDVTVAATGSVLDASIADSELNDVKAEACIERVAERLRFPPSSKPARVSYLWIFVRGQ